MKVIARHTTFGAKKPPDHESSGKEAASGFGRIVLLIDLSGQRNNRRNRDQAERRAGNENRKPGTDRRNQHGCGALSTLTLIALSPAVQIDLLHHPHAIFPLKTPALVTIPLSFLTGIIVSLLKPDTDGDARYAAMERRLLLGAE